MIHYFNSKKMPDGSFLITNDFGRYAFIDNESYSDLCKNRINNANKFYYELVEKGFVIDGGLESFVKQWAAKIQDMKSYCFSGTSLHIFAVTNACNMDCRYCQAHSRDSSLDGMMDPETGRKAIDVALQSPNKWITFEFQGGEPLLNFDTVKDMVLYSEERNIDKHIEYTIVTNLTRMTDEMLDFLCSHGVNICTSLDGPQIVHDYNRPYRDRSGGSYFDVIDKIRYIQNKGINVSAIQTTTRKSLKYYKEIVDEYRKLGIHHVFIRPLTPLGLAESSWEDVGYSEEEFLDFYRNIFEYIMELNLQGVKFVETHALYFLKKILQNFSYNYMELRSPCGATLGQLSYYYDGSVYTCDEGRMMSEMNDYSFKLGDVHSNSYSDLVNSPVCKTLCKSSIIEGVPKCNDCVYQPYCGICPIVNYASTNDLYSKNKKDFRCAAYKGIMNTLFEQIRKDDDTINRVFQSWLE